MFKVSDKMHNTKHQIPKCTIQNTKSNKCQMVNRFFSPGYKSQQVHRCLVEDRGTSSRSPVESAKSPQPATKIIFFTKVSTTCHKNKNYNKSLDNLPHSGFSIRFSSQILLMLTYFRYMFIGTRNNSKVLVFTSGKPIRRFSSSIS